MKVRSVKLQPDSLTVREAVEPLELSVPAGKPRREEG